MGFFKVGNDELAPMMDDIRDQRPGAMEAFMSRFENSVLGILTRKAKEDHGLAQEHCQKFFESVHRSLAIGRTRVDTPGAWLNMSLGNRKIAMAEERARLERSRPFGLAGEEKPVNPDLLDAGDGSSRGVEERQLLRDISRALGEIPSRERAPLMLWIEGRSYQEISDLLEVPKGTVKCHIHRGRKRLRNKLRPWGHGEG